MHFIHEEESSFWLVVGKMCVLWSVVYSRRWGALPSTSRYTRNTQFIDRVWTVVATAPPLSLQPPPKSPQWGRI